jgi:hypothetical protein
MAGAEMDIKNKAFLVTGGTSIRVSGFPNRRQAERLLCIKAIACCPQKNCLQDLQAIPLLGRADALCLWV